MKRNLSLTVVLATLLVFTYYYQEIGSFSNKNSDTQSTPLFQFDFKLVDKIEFPNVELVKKNNQWNVESMNYSADAKILIEVKKLLKGLVIVREIKFDKKNVSQFFSSNDHKVTFHVHNKVYKFRIGDISSIDGFFYLGVITDKIQTVYQVKDNNNFDIAYKNELDLNYKKYMRLKELLKKDYQFYIEKELFKNDSFEKLETVNIKNISTEEFVIDIKKKCTFPLPPTGLGCIDNIKNVTSSLLSSIRIKNIYNSSRSQLSQLVSTIKIKGEKNTIQLELFNYLNKVRGHFLKISGDSSWVFEVTKNSSNIFYTETQEFWNRRVFNQKKLQELKQFDFAVSSTRNDKDYYFYVNDIKNFKITNNEVDVRNLNIENFNLLFHVIFGLRDFSKNQILSFKTIKKSPHIRVKILGKDLGVIFDKFEIILVNYGDKYNIHHQYELKDRQIVGLKDFFDFNY